MSDYIRKEMARVVVGAKCNDLVLRTLGKVYVSTGGQMLLLDDLIASVMEEQQGSYLTAYDTEQDYKEGTHDSQFVFVKETGALYVNVNDEYILIVSNKNDDEEVEEAPNTPETPSTPETPDNSGSTSTPSNFNPDDYVKKSGDEMTGELVVPLMTVAGDLIVNTIYADDLLMSDHSLIPGLNAEYIGGLSAEDLLTNQEDSTQVVKSRMSYNTVQTYNEDIIANSSLKSDNFISGYSGNGWSIDAETNTLTIDNLVVRKIMNVYELAVNNQSATNGNLYVSDSVTVKSFETTRGYHFEDDSYIIENKELIDALPTNLYELYYKITTEDTVNFKVGDIIKGEKYADETLKSFHAIVELVSGNSFIIQLYTEDVELREGDVLVRVGNLIDEDRQNTIYLTSSDDGAPYIDFKTGMNEPDGGKVKVRIGNLSGITDNVLGTLSGHGLYAENVYLKGKIVLVASDGEEVPTVIYRGVWSNAATYGYYEQVTYLGSLYIWVDKNNLADFSDVPGVSSNWVINVSKGDTGSAVTPNWKNFIFIDSEEKPAAPEFKHIDDIAEPWVDAPDGDGHWWMSVATINGLTNEVIGSWSDPADTRGEQGVSISEVTELYALGTSETEAPETGWDSNKKTPTEDLPYLWNKEIQTLSNGEKLYTNPKVVYRYTKDGDPGVGIKYIEEYYTISDSITSAPSAGWTTDKVTVTADEPYLWNYTQTTLTNDEVFTSSPLVIGTFSNNGTYVSYLFCKSDTLPTTTPKTAPNDWEDAPDSDGVWWMSMATINGNTGEAGDWSTPIKATGEDGVDGAYCDFKYAISESTAPSVDSSNNNPGNSWSDSVPERGDNQKNWYIWMIFAYRGEDGNILKNWSSPRRISGENGADGLNGAKTVFKFSKNDSETDAPKLDVYQENNTGWDVQGGSGISEGKQVWMTSATYIWSLTKNTYVFLAPWATPERVSGEKGEPGKDGLDGLDGQDGKDGQDGQDGPCAVFYGEYDAEAIYPVSDYTRCVVKITTGEDAIYYMTKTTKELGAIATESIKGQDPKAEVFWKTFGGNFQSIATGLLLAENANIANFVFKDLMLNSDAKQEYEYYEKEEAQVYNYREAVSSEDTTQEKKTGDVAKLRLDGNTGEIIACNFKTAPDPAPRVEIDLNSINIFGYFAKNIRIGVDANTGMAELVYYDNKGQEIYRLDSSGIKKNQYYNQNAIIYKNSYDDYGVFILDNPFTPAASPGTIYYCHVTTPVYGGEKRYEQIDGKMFEAISFTDDGVLESATQLSNGVYHVISNKPDSLYSAMDLLFIYLYNPELFDLWNVSGTSYENWDKILYEAYPAIIFKLDKSAAVTSNGELIYGCDIISTLVYRLMV